MTTRRKLPVTRKGITHRVEIDAPDGKFDLYITVNTYADGKPGEVFAKIGLSECAWLDQWCRAVSIIIQDGHSVRELVQWFGFARYEPAGFTDNKAIKTAYSITDYIVRFLDHNFGDKQEKTT